MRLRVYRGYRKEIVLELSVSGRGGNKKLRIGWKGWEVASQFSSESFET